MAGATPVVIFGATHDLSRNVRPTDRAPRTTAFDRHVACSTTSLHVECGLSDLGADEPAFTHIKMEWRVSIAIRRRWIGAASIQNLSRSAFLKRVMKNSISPPLRRMSCRKSAWGCNLCRNFVSCDSKSESPAEHSTSPPSNCGHIAHQWNLLTDSSNVDLLAVKIPWAIFESLLTCTVYAGAEYLLRTIFSNKDEMPPAGQQ
jgi:hypothetical protein